MSDHRVDPRLLVAVGVLFTSFSSIFIRLADAPALAVAANRMILTTVMLVPLLLHERLSARAARRKADGGAGTETPALPRLIPVCLLSGLFLAVHFATWIRSLDLTTIASATVIVNTQPLFVVVFGLVLYGEKVSRRAVWWMTVTFAGGALLSSGDISLGREALLGDLFALLGAISVAGYMLIGRYARRHLSARTYVFVVYGSSALFLVAIARAWGTPITGYPVREYLLFAAMAFFCTILGHTVFNWALKYLKTSFVSTIILGEPVFATILGLVIFAEIPPILTIVGGGVMLVGLSGFVREESGPGVPRGGRTARSRRHT